MPSSRASTQLRDGTHISLCLPALTEGGSLPLKREQTTLPLSGEQTKERQTLCTMEKRKYWEVETVGQNSSHRFLKVCHLDKRFDYFTNNGKERGQSLIG